MDPLLKSTMRTSLAAGSQDSSSSIVAGGNRSRARHLQDDTEACEAFHEWRLPTRRTAAISMVPIPVKLAEVPAFAPNGADAKPYSLEEVSAMLKVLSEPSATAVATAAFTGLRLGELRGITWETYESAPDAESLGWLSVTRSVWCSTIGDPKTAKSKASVPVIPQLAHMLDAHRRPDLCKYLGEPSRSG